MKKQYIDKSTLVAEIKKRVKGVNRLIDVGCNNKEEFSLESVLIAEIHAYEDILDDIDTLEVKEVDLNEEYIEEIYSHIDGIRDTADRMTSGNFMHHRAAIKFSANVIEQVLGLIGLKTQKGK